MLDRGEDANFVERVLLFLAREFLHLYLFHCVYCVVGLASDLENFTERALT